jgi:hypothetical protein
VDNATPIQSISYMPAPSRGHSLYHLLLSLFPLTPLLITSNLFSKPTPTTDAATPEEYSLGDAAPSGGYHISHTSFTPSALGGWHEP